MGGKEEVWKEGRASGCDLCGKVSPLLLSHSIVLFL